MSCYISSNENRFYTAAEPAYGAAQAVTEDNRVPAVKLVARQQLERADRRDKTGSRTFWGVPAGARHRTSFDLTTYMTTWSPSAAEPSYGPLFLAALGAAPVAFAGGTVGSSSGTQLTFTGSHGLVAGQAVSCQGEMRFVTSVVDSSTVQINAPWTANPSPGAPAGRTVTYMPASDVGSVTIYDYWSPVEAVHRILAGAAVNTLAISVNGDFHEFRFGGQAKDLIDSASFVAGQAGLSGYPAEPAVNPVNYPVVPGNLGQAWLGVGPDQFFTITGAEVALDNSLDLRTREFGLDSAQCIAGGQRSVRATFSLFEKADAATKGLYQAARERTPIPVMFQLGQQATQLFGVYMKNLVPEVPEFLDDETRLEWRFRDCQAQGTIDDEIVVAFG